MQRYTMLISLALALAGVPTDGAARCAFRSLAVDFRSATQVYLATLVQEEFSTEVPPDEIDAELAKDLPANGRHRFVLEVDRVFKGAPGSVVEKRKTDYGIVVISGSPLLLERLDEGTSVLMFEPHWDSHCSRSTVVDFEVIRDLLPTLEKLSRRGA